MTVEEWKATADEIFNRDGIHMNCEVDVVEHDDCFWIRVNPRKFPKFNISVCVEPGKSKKEDKLIELEVAREAMIESIFGDVHWWDLPLEEQERYFASHTVSTTVYEGESP